MTECVRVLIVTDDFTQGFGPRGGFLRWKDQSSAAATSEASREFHLGEFVHCLERTNWVGFKIEIVKAHRVTVGTNGMNEAELKADRGADVVGFRFNQPFAFNGESWTLSSFDEILFFAIRRKDPDPTLAPEAEAIAEYMESGGGFFATGDHENLGAELCALIPRVRSMRRWWKSKGPNDEPAAPPANGPDRHDTTRAGKDGVTHVEDQSDEFAQPIKPVMYSAGFASHSGYPAHKHLPHPLLCSPAGRIAWLPDHMHEGWCEVPNKLASRTFQLKGASVREYPDLERDSPLAPEIVAYGTVLPKTVTPALSSEHIGDDNPATGKDFGVIGAWDGHRVGKGRVVVDSTWHHFFDINLSGDRYLEDLNLGSAHEQKAHGFYVKDAHGNRVANAQYKMIQWYFRNIIYWLLPASRLGTLWWQTLLGAARQSRFREELGDTIDKLPLEAILYFGRQAEEYLASVRGACASYEVHRYIYEPKIPWWEWVQEVVDIWNPQPGERRQVVRRDMLLGAMGAGSRPELPATLALGSAMIAVASLQGRSDDRHFVRAALAAFRSALDHAAEMLKAAVLQGKNQGRRLEELAAAQLAAKR